MPRQRSEKTAELALGSLGEVLNNVILEKEAEGTVVKFPKPKPSVTRILAAIIKIGGGGPPQDPFKPMKAELTVGAEPGPEASDWTYMVVTGPTSNTVTDSRWTKGDRGLSVNYITLSRVHFRHNGTAGVSPIKPWLKYRISCPCGHVSEIGSQAAQRRMQWRNGSKVEDRLKCEKCGLGFNAELKLDRFEKLAAARPEIFTRLMPDLEEIPGGTDAVQKAWVEAVKAGRNGNFAEHASDVLPFLVGVFPAGSATGTWVPKGSREKILVDGYANTVSGHYGVRPYDMLKEEKGLGCDWKWFAPTLTVGWVPIAALYSAGDPKTRGNRKVAWDDGYSSQFIFRRKEQDRPARGGRRKKIKVAPAAQPIKVEDLPAA